MSRTAAVALVAALALAGCTRYAWVKPLGDPATFPADSYACKQEALAAAPPVFQTYLPGPGFGPPGHYYAPPPPRTVDLNAPLRDDFYDSCLRARGWVLQAIEER